MRNKFSELIQQGVAAPRYENIINNTTLRGCNLCRIYNNHWGMPTDTHMSEVDGEYIITGSLLRSSRKWDCLLYSRFWGGVDFSTSGVNSLNELLYRYGYTPKYTTKNSDPVITLVPNEPAEEATEVPALKESVNEWNPSFNGHKDAYNNLVKWYDKTLKHMNNEEIMDLLKYFVSDIESGAVEAIK